MLRVRALLLEERATVDGRLVALAKSDPVTRLLMTAPGVGVVVALSFRSAVDNPARFRRSRDVGSWLGLTPRRWQSGKTDIVGRITKAGDARVRTMLFEAAATLLGRVRVMSPLKAWGLSEDYRDMIYAETPGEIATRRKAFLRKWRLKCKSVADSLEEAGDKLFTFTRLPQSQWKSARTTNAIERLNEEFRRPVKTQTVLPCAETVPMLLWALTASGQIIMRKVDGWETLPLPVADAILGHAA